MRHETHTRMKCDEIFTAARKFFGEEEGGIGMKLGAEQGFQIQFFGKGLVWITVWPAQPRQNEVRVDLDVSERDAEARAFIEKVLKAAPA